MEIKPLKRSEQRKQYIELDYTEARPLEKDIKRTKVVKFAKRPELLPLMSSKEVVRSHHDLHVRNDLELNASKEGSSKNGKKLGICEIQPFVSQKKTSKDNGRLNDAFRITSESELSSSESEFCSREEKYIKSKKKVKDLMENSTNNISSTNKASIRFVTTLLSSTIFSKVLKMPLATCQQGWNNC